MAKRVESAGASVSFLQLTVMEANAPMSAFFRWIGATIRSTQPFAMSGTAAWARATGGELISGMVRIVTTSLAALPVIGDRLQDRVTPASEVIGVPPSQLGGGGATKTSPVKSAACTKEGRA